VGEVNRPAPAITLATLDGEEVQLSDYEGQVVLVNFWGTWCEPCKRETPALQTAYEELNDQGLVIIGVNLTNDEITLGNSEADIHAFAEQYNVTYPIALDRMGEARKAFSVYPLPTSFFIDPYGNIRYVRVGEITTQEVTELFTALQQETTARSE
jgi:peroxiredoxin